MNNTMNENNISINDIKVFEDLSKQLSEIEKEVVVLKKIVSLRKLDDTYGK